MSEESNPFLSFPFDQSTNDRARLQSWPPQPDFAKCQTEEFRIHADAVGEEFLNKNANGEKPQTTKLNFSRDVIEFANCICLPGRMLLANSNYEQINTVRAQQRNQVLPCDNDRFNAQVLHLQEHRWVAHLTCRK